MEEGTTSRAGPERAAEQNSLRMFVVFPLPGGPRRSLMPEVYNGGGRSRRQTARVKKFQDELPGGAERERGDQGSLWSPSQRTVHLPSLGKPGAWRAGAPSHPAAIMAAAASRPPLPGR